MIAVLVMTDGRDRIHQTVRSFEDSHAGTISERWIHDDSGNRRNADRLRRAFPDYRIITTSGRSGFGGAIANAWSTLQAESSAPYVWHLEDDFTFDRTIELDVMAEILDRYPHLVQIALRRQPWNREEIAAGGVVEQHPDDYVEQFDPELRAVWLEHARFFTTNPSLYRRTLMARGWPNVSQSEGIFWHQLRAEQPELRSAYWGARSSGEWCRHTGHKRIGIGY